MTRELSSPVLTFLLQKAVANRLTTYEEIAITVGLPTSGEELSKTLSDVLTGIAEACMYAKFPPLTSLVVRKSGADKGIPGNGYWKTQGLSNLDPDKRRLVGRAHQQSVFDLINSLHNLDTSMLASKPQLVVEEVK